MTTAPYFPLYLKDWLMDTRGFSHEDKGVLIDLLVVAWERGGLPLEAEKVRALAGCSATAWKRAWPTVQAHWIARDGLLIYPKLEAARANLKQRSDAGRVGALKRWSADATAMRSHSDGNAASHDNRNAITDNRLQEPPNPLSLASARSPESRDDEPTVLRFPTVGPQRSWALSASQLETWRGLFPTSDVEAECRAALAWLLANPTRQKTARGMASFLVSWLGRSNDRRPAASSGAVPFRPSPPDNPTVAQLMAEREARRARALAAEAEDAAALAATGETRR